MTPTPRLILIGFALACLLTAIAISDWRHYRVPDRLVGLTLGLRALDILTSPPGGRVDDLVQSAARAVVMVVLFYAFRFAYRRWRGREGMGLGDVKLAAVAGAWVDWPRLPTVVEVAALIGVAVALFRAARGHERLHAGAKLPFAVGFAVAIFVGWQMRGVNL